MKTILLMICMAISINAFCQTKDTVNLKESAKEHFLTGSFIVSAAAIGSLVNYTSVKESPTLYYVCTGIGAVGLTYYTIAYFKYRKLNKLRKMSLK